MDRLDYAHANRQRYLDWVGAVSQAPYTRS